MSTQTQSKRLIGKRAVGARYDGRHPRTIERWVKAGVLPPPDQVIRQRWYWFESTLDEHDRQNTVANAQSSAPRGISAPVTPGIE